MTINDFRFRYTADAMLPTVSTARGMRVCVVGLQTGNRWTLMFYVFCFITGTNHLKKKLQEFIKANVIVLSVRDSYILHDKKVVN